MYVTVLPVSSTTYYCSPKSNLTSTFLIAKRAFQLMSGFGLSINGKHTFCGDYIYSGHTVMLVLGYLIIAECKFYFYFLKVKFKKKNFFKIDSPRRFIIVHWLSWIAALVGVSMVLLAHGHYTIDVLIAYYVTTRMFWTYHTLANNSFLIKPANNNNNYLGKEWWFIYFKYFERNVRGPVPRQYEWPLPWPRRFHSKLPNRES